MTQAKPKKSNTLLKSGLIGLCAVGMGALYMSMSVILFIGMLPTLIPMMLRRFKPKVSDLTIGAINFAGCMPFLLQLSQEGSSIKNALDIALEPSSVVIMYLCAAFGHGVNIGITSAASQFLLLKGKARRKEIKKRQEALVETWGEKVTGAVRLDQDGFPMEEF